MVKRKVDDETAQAMARMRQQGLSIRQISEVVGVSHATAHRALRLLDIPKGDGKAVELDLDGLRLKAMRILNSRGPVRAKDIGTEIGASASMVRLALGEDEWMLAPEPHDIAASYTDEQIFKAIHKVARKYGEPLTKAKYDFALLRGEIVGPTHVRLVQRYGSWSALCSQLGYSVGRARRSYQTKWTDDEIWGYVVRFITESESPAFRFWDSWRKKSAPKAPSSTMLRNRLGKWNDIYTEAVRRLMEENKKSQGAA